MGSSLAKLFKKEVRILMVGLSYSGKTQIFNKMKLGAAITTAVTVGVHLDTLEYKNFSFLFLDCGGQNVGLPLLRFYFYYELGGLVYVVDSNDHDRVLEARDDLHLKLKEDTLRDLPLLVLANKQDLPNAMNAAEITDKLDLRSLQHHCWHIQSTSAITGEGLDEGLEWLASNVANKG